MNPRAFYLEQTEGSPRVETYVGRKAYEALLRFAASLGAQPPLYRSDGRHRSDGRPSSFDARLAPSVVVRSDLQLLNIDTPRFAVRVYLNSDHTSFVNLRRMIDMRRRVRSAKWFASAQPFIVGGNGERKELYYPDNNWMGPAHAFRELNKSGNAIADCVFTPSSKARGDYDFVTAELGWVYGEGKSIKGVPFVRPLSGFGGAACAQSCAFMVATLLHDYPASPTAEEYGEPGIHGLAEITAITTGSTRRMLRLSGLTPRILLEYFTKTGRRAVQYSFGRSRPESDVAHHQASLAMSLMSVYVRSGFATILGVTSPEGDERLPGHNHAVVVIGASKPGHHRRTLVANDPSNRPFDKMDLPDLIHRSTIALTDKDKRVHEFSQPEVYCVLPHPVRVPLADASVTLDGLPTEVVGVEKMSRSLMRNPAFVQLQDGYRPPALEDFLLVRIVFESRVPTQRRVRLPAQVESMLHNDNSFRLLWEAEENLGPFVGRWCWLQTCHTASGEIDFVLLWDAELVPILMEEAKADQTGRMFGAPLNFVLASFSRNGGTWSFESHTSARPIPKRPEEQYAQRSDQTLRTEWHVNPDLEKVQKDTKERVQHIETEQGGIQESEIRESRYRRLVRFAVGKAFPWLLPEPVPSLDLSDEKNWPLRPCLITSFTTHGLSTAAANWPKCIKHSEVYAFMHRDRELLEGIFDGRRGTSKSIVEILSSIPASGLERVEAIDLLANRLRHFANSTGTSIHALATYMPQMFGADAQLAEAAIKAMGVLLELRAKLEDDERCRIQTIELVSGSVISGLFPARGNNSATSVEPTLFGVRRLVDEGYREVLNSLERVCRTMRTRVHKTPFSFALELEPGPLFVLNRTRSLLDLANAIQESPRLRSMVGFNVDIAHFALAGIEPEKVFESELLADRICHFHVSDHGIGHFGDTRIGDCSFGQWLRTSTDNLKIFDRWLTMAMRYAAKQRHRSSNSPRFSGLISVEFEAAESPQLVEQSCKQLVELLQSAARAVLSPGSHQFINRPPGNPPSGGSSNPPSGPSPSSPSGGAMRSR